jgi:imidazolonepropionase
VLVEHIGELVTNDPSAGEGPLGILRDAAVVLDGDRVAWVGPSGGAPEGVEGPRIDAAGAAALPGFVDSHTHLVFAGDRTAEFDARMRGEPYAAGGIRTTVAATRAASDEALLAACAIGAKAESSGIATGRDDDVVFESPGVSVKHEVDVRIGARYTHRRVCRKIDAGNRAAAEAVHARSLRFDAVDLRVRIHAGELESHVVGAGG